MLERKNLALSMQDACIKASGDGGYSFEGYASKFNGVDSYGDTILPGAYKNALTDMRKNGRMAKMFFNHNVYGLPTGKWRKMEEDTDGLFVAGTLTKGMSLVEDIKLALADGTLDGLSVGIGMKSEDYEWVEDPKSTITRIIKNVTSLREVSLVTFPADDKGRIDVDTIKTELEHVASLQDLEAFLRDAGGFSKAAATAVASRAKAILRGEHDRDASAKSAQLEVSAMLTAFKLPTFGTQ